MRVRSASYGEFGAPFCRSIEAPLVDAKALIAQANTLGFGADQLVVQSKYAVDEIDQMIIYIPFVGNDCERHTAELEAVNGNLRALIMASSNIPVPPSRPTENVGGPAEYGLPTWVKFVAVGAVGLFLFDKVSGFIPKIRR